MKLNPKKVIDKAETFLQAWEEIAPQSTFAGKTLEEFKAEVKKSQDVRSRIADLESQLTNALHQRDIVDEATVRLSQFVINSVAGDPNYGKDSGLYKAMGYTPTSERKSGLTRGKKSSAV